MVKYLKAAQVLIMQSVGGHRLKDAGLLGPRVRRSRSGLPYFIPREHRWAMRRGDKVVVRAWLTLTGIYRVIDFPVGTPKLDTITAPYKGIKMSFSSILRFAEEGF